MVNLSKIWKIFRFGFVALGISFSAQSQVLRSFGNTGFELPVSPIVAPCYSELQDVDVPSWSTTHPSASGGQDNCNYPGTSANGGINTGNPNVTSGNNGTTYTGSFIELQAHAFRSAYSSRRVVSRDGVQHAELSAKVNSSLYQQICLVPGETVSWSFSHLGVQQVGTPDVMRFVIGNSVASINAANIATTAVTGGIVNASTTTAGVGTLSSCHQGSSVTQAVGCTVTQTTVTSPAGISPIVNTTWADYSGAFTWTGTSGVKYIAFGAITPTGDFGNYIDRVIVNLKPYVEFAGASASGLESLANPGTIGIRVTGNVPTTMIVPITVTGGTATLGADYTTPSGTATFNITVPAGNYDGTTIIGAGISITPDAVLEGNETIILSIGTNPNFVISSTTVCGSPPNNVITYTITDDDRPQLRINKTRIGGTGTINFPFAVTNTATANATIATLASGTPATVAALNTTPITIDGVAVTVTETLPAGSAANGFWGLSAVSCLDANAGNTALQNTNPATNLAVLAGNVFTIPAANVQHTSNITCNVTNILVNAVDDAANKIVNLPSTTSVNTNDIYPTGSTFTVTGGTCAAKTPASPTTNTTGLLAYTSPATTGATCTVIYQVCAPAPNTAVCDTATLVVTATAPEAALVITKTDNKTSTISGSTNDYVVTLTNQGPSPANGVVLTDTPSAGLTCPPASPVVCSVIAGLGVAVCPTGPLTLGALISPGYTIVTFPANSGLQFTYTCTVN